MEGFLVRRFLLVGVALVTVAFASSFASAASTSNNGTDKYSFAGASADGGSCGNSWANDTYTLDFSIKQAAAGVYSVNVMYKNGSFVTIAGASPGACSTVNHHGSLVNGGINGKFQGWVSLTMTSATYNASGCVSNPSCTTRTGVLNALFPGGSSSNWNWNFEYSSSDKTLAYHSWQDKADQQTGNDKFEGDIANS
jgi:hypothetical protein